MPGEEDWLDTDRVLLPVFVGACAGRGLRVSQFPGFGIDANGTTAGDQAFTLVSGAAFTATGQLLMSYETRADGEYPVIQGNVGGNLDADFKISIEGHQNLTNANLNL